MNVFPSLVGISWPVTVSPLWNAQVQRTLSGRVVAATYQQYPLYKFAVKFSYLPAADFNTLLAFFNAQQGNVVPFWFDAGTGQDAVTAQGIGTGNGTQTAFQLLRSYGGFSEPIAAAFGTTHAYVNGTAQTATFNSPSNGYVTFATAPASGTAVTWTGNYYFQVRFAKGSADIDQFMSQLYRTKTVDLETYL